ncbi:MAG TPA: hypothetical protein VMU82_01150 [Acetobacteraceae bacterium]|nr:hypothetical protein [Acetobacteraceae bacterium]
MSLIAPIPSPAAGPVTAPAATSAGFLRTLESLDPLHDLPGLGTICRAVSRDALAPALQVAGSAAIGFLTGGPVGAGISLGESALGALLSLQPAAARSAVVPTVSAAYARTMNLL